MRVIKRNGELEEIAFDKILNRIKKLGLEANININYSSLTMKVIDQLYDKIQTTKIDELTADHCISLSTHHPDYANLAGRIVISNHQKNTSPSFSEVMKQLYYFYDIHGEHSPIVSQELWEMVSSHCELFDKMVCHERDYLIDFFGFKTLERAYLCKVANIIVERPQYMWLRVAIGIHGTNIDDIKETYDLMSQKYFTHATPTLFNAGTPRPQLSSCFLQAMENDSVDGIYNTLKECAQISKYSGGIGLHIHNIRCKNSHIRGTNGKTDGIVPMLKVFNSTARYINQSGKRNGSFAIYLEPWHGDIESFLEMRKNHGDEEMKARDLFYALWIPDLFMERIKENKKWSLFCPDECPGLSDVYGSKFKELYETYESTGKARKTVEARDLWFKVLDAQMETGTPYLLYKDAANMKSNQKNIGIIKSSNLCVAPETLVLTDNGQIPIHELECKEIKVWNGQMFSDTMVFKTGENQELIEVETSDGCVLYCTPYHRFFIENPKSTAKDKEASIVEAQHLTVNDVIVACDFPIIDGEIHLETFDITDIPKGAISMDSKMKWLSLFCEKYGIVSSKINLLKSAISIMHKNKETLMSVKHLLQTCGINAPLSKTCYYNYLYPDTAYYTLKINSTQLRILMDHGFRYGSPIITALLQKKYDDVADVSLEPIKVIRITSNGRKDDTYCFNEPLNHAGIFNGILTSQCTEIIQVSDEKETSVCNLASIGLPTCVDEKTRTFDYKKLHQVTKVITKNLNKIIDINYYPTAKSQRSNLLNRPIGIGVQGLADVFMMLDVPFHSDLAKKINIDIFETIYHAALEKSNEIAIDRHNKLKRFHSFYNNLKTLSPNKQEEYVKPDVTFEDLSELKIVYGEMNNLSNEKCGAYSSFEGSPASLGYLQFDMWNVVPTTDRYDWSYLKQSIRKFGLRNSLLLAPMPTASTSQILGFNECFEPITSNIYSRSTLAGEFILANKYLMNDLIGLGLWNERIKDNIIANKGSIQQLTVLPQHIRDKYKIVWEIPMKHVIDMSAERGAYICQSQSLNLWLEDPNYNTLTSMHFYAWKKGLKTGIYYLRRKAKHCPQQFSIEPERKQEDENTQHDEICEMCSA